MTDYLRPTTITVDVVPDGSNQDGYIGSVNPIGVVAMRTFAAQILNSADCQNKISVSGTLDGSHWYAINDTNGNAYFDGYATEPTLYDVSCYSELKLYAYDVELDFTVTYTGYETGVDLATSTDLTALNAEVDSNWSELNTQTASIRDSLDGYVISDAYEDCFLGNTLVTSLENPVITLTPTDSADIDAALSNVYIVDLVSATTTVAIELSNFAPGMSVAIQFIQDATVPQQVSYGAYVKHPDGVEPVLSVGSLAKDLHVILFTGSDYLCTVSKNFS